MVSAASTVRNNVTAGKRGREARKYRRRKCRREGAEGVTGARKMLVRERKFIEHGAARGKCRSVALQWRQTEKYLSSESVVAANLLEMAVFSSGWPGTIPALLKAAEDLFSSP